MSVFRYFTSELTRGYLLEREEEKYALKRQRVYTFIRTPTELEKVEYVTLTHKAPPRICSRRQFQILLLFQN